MPRLNPSAPDSNIASRARASVRPARWLTSAACVLSLFSALQLSAANTWDGGGGDANWSTPDNWDDNLVPTFPVPLSFGGTVRLQSTNDLSSPTTVNGFTFQTGAGAFVLGGTGVSLGGDIDNASASQQTVNLPLTLTAARTINTSFGDIAIGGGISGAFDINKRGAKTLTLSGVLTTTNRIGVGSFPNGAGMTPSTHQGGGTLVLDFSAAGSPVSNILYGGVTTFSATQEVRLADGTLVLKGKDATNNSQQIGQLGIATGFNTVSLQPGAGGKMLLNAGAIAVAGGATNDNNKSSLVNFILPPGTQDSTNGVTTTAVNHASGMLAPISGSIANIVVNGSSWATNATNAAGGNIIPLPDSSYFASTANTTGNTTQNVDMVTDTSVANPSPWTIRFNNTGVTGPRILTNTSPTSAMTIGGGGILVTSGMGSDNVTITGGPIRGSSNRGLFISNYNTGGGRLVIDSNIVNNGNTNALTVGGGGFVRLNASNSTYTSGTYILKGTTLSIASDNALGAGFGSVSVASASTSSPTVTLAATGPATGAWVVGTSFLGSTIATISGTTITLAGNATADISTATSVAYATAPALTIDGGTLQADGTFELRRTQPADVSGVGGSATSDRRIGLGGNGGTIEVTSGNTFTVSGAVSSQTLRGFGALRKTGPGTLVLSGANTYSGGTTVSAGALRAGSSSALGSSGATLTLAAGAALQTNGQSVTVGGLAADASAVIENSNATNGTLVVNSSQNITVSAILQNGTAGLLQLTKQGAGSLTLATANTHGGDTLLSSGSLVLSHSLALQNSSLNQQIASGSGLVFDASVSSRAFTLGGIKNNQTTHSIVLENNAATPQPVALTVGGNNRAGAYSGTLSGSGSLAKAGNATLTLTGANTYSGGTTIGSGTLALTGVGAVGAGPLVLSAGAIFDVSALDAATVDLPSSLSGAGLVNAGTKTVNLPGALSLAGQLDITGGLALGAGSARAFRITGSASRDRLVVSGHLALDGDLTLYTAEGAALAAGQTHDFYDAATLATGLDSVTVNGLVLAAGSGVWTGSANGLAYTFTEGTGELVVASASTPLSAIETWRQSFFGSPADSGSGADAFDYDSDGLANLLEYALGTSPVAPSGPASSVSLSGGRLAISFQRIADPALTYTVQVANDLAGTWTTLAVAGNPSTGAANVAGLVTVTDTASASAQPRRFLRLVVTR